LRAAEVEAVVDLLYVLLAAGLVGALICPSNLILAIPIRL
jgi:hypothetical protein